MVDLSRTANTSLSDRAALAAIACVVVAALFQAVDAVIVRMLSPDIHPFTIAFTRALFGLLVFLPWISMHRGILVSHYRLRHVVRATLKLGALVAYFAAFAIAPLADVTAIAFTAPIFVTLGAWVILRERPRSLRIAAMLLGFAGVMFVLKPGQHDELPVGLLLALLGAVLTATIQLILKPMAARDSTETLVAWNLIVTVPIAAVPLFWFWTEPTAAQWGLLALQGALGAVSMGLITRAFALAEATLIAPLDFLRLPMVAGLAYLVLGQPVSLQTWIGGIIIFVATLLMARSARYRPVVKT